MNAKKTNTMKPTIANEFIDSELLDEEFNSPRSPRLPYAIIINDNPAGLFIPEKNLAKAGWIGTHEITEIELTGGTEKGVFLTSPRMLILGNIPPYIRYKKLDDEINSMTVIGEYNENKHVLDKKTMDAVSEHLVVFLNEVNEPIHQRPFTIRFKNVALWSLREALDEFYTQCELVFAKLTGTRASGKNDRWRSLCIFACNFKGIKEGEGSNKSWCCKIENYQIPTADNFSSLFLGQKTQKTQIWEMLDMNVGFNRTLLPAAPTKSALPPADDFPY